MIALLAALALHLTPPEQFFCDDLHGQTLHQCIRKTREWICRSDALRDTDEPDALYVQTVREERRLICRKRKHHVCPQGVAP